MGIMKLNEVYDPSGWEETGNDDGRRIYTQQMYVDEFGNIVPEPYTIIARTSTRRQFMSSINNPFINRIRAVAEIWHNVLDDAARAVWLAANLYYDAARPGMDKGQANGWNLFAMVALAPVAWSATPDGYEAFSVGAGPDYLVFSKADSETQVLHFTAGFSEPPYSDSHMFAFVHQVDPYHVDRLDADRRTLCAGYYQFLGAPTGDQEFSALATFPFNAGDKVQVLMRIHRSLSGVDNHILTCTAI
jgi:hypothetical protein